MQRYDRGGQLEAIAPEVKEVLVRLDESMRDYASRMNENMLPIGEALVAWRIDVARRSAEAIRPTLDGMRRISERRF